jgi:hypothetical protein
MGNLALALILWISQQAAIPDTAALLASLQGYFQELSNGLPDFTCSEHLVYRRVRGGKVKEQIVTESIFRVAKQDSGTGWRLYDTHETLTIDGRPVQKNKTPKHGFSAGIPGVFAVSAFTITEAQEYHPVSIEQIDGREAIRVEFVTKENQKSLSTKINGKPYYWQDSGVAWLDIDSMRLLRLDRRQVKNLPAPVVSDLMVLDQSRVDIGGEAYWMPRHSKTEIALKNGETEIWEQDWTNYKKFGSAVKIRSPQ